MICNDIIEELNQRFPPEMAEEWDNPGLLTGRYNAPVRKILVTLDVSDQAVAEAVSMGADLIVSHHPLIFGGIRQVNDHSLTGRRVLSLIEHGIACFAMHTNYDVCRMPELNGAQLQLSGQEVLLETGRNENGPYGIGRIGMLPEEMTLTQLAGFVRGQMRLPQVIVYGEEDRLVRKAAVSGGSGKSVVRTAAAKGAEVLITGDLDYHTATDAVSDGMCMIDAGHYGTEYCFIEDVASLLAEQFPMCEVRGASINHPYYIV